MQHTLWRGEVQILPGVGHAPHVEASQDFAKTVAAFITEGEVVGEHERVGQAGLVVLAVDFGGDDVVAVVGLGVGEGGPDDLVADALTVGPPLDGFGSPDFAPRQSAADAAAGSRRPVPLGGTGTPEPPIR